MARARGANAKLAAAYESTYGVPPGSGFRGLPFVSSQLGAEQPLLESDLLGSGRESYDPTYDVVTNDGDVVVPIDVRYFGYWLKLLLGDPDSSGTPAAAGGVLTLAANVANGDTVTIGARTYTFQSTLTNVDGNVKVGASAAASITNLYRAINASGGTPGTDYALSTTAHPAVLATASSSTTLTVAARTMGPAGNAITTTEVGANTSWGAATLAGGAAATHVYESGATALPSLAIETQFPDLPSYEMSYGMKANQLRIAMQRRGLLNATLSLVGKGQLEPASSSAAGSLATVLTVDRFAQATGEITRNGVKLGSIVSADLGFSNNLDKIETIQPDGEIEDADGGTAMASGSLTARYDNTVLASDATNGEAVALSWGWTYGDFSLTIECPRVFLPRVKHPISGPGGVQATYNWQASGEGGPCLTATLVNDREEY